MKEKWIPFVANRILEIHELLNTSLWRDSDGKLYSIDLIATGCFVKQLKSPQKWWYGLEFLSLPEVSGPKLKYLQYNYPIFLKSELERQQPFYLVWFKEIRQGPQNLILKLSKYSSLKRLYRVTNCIGIHIYLYY